MNETRYSLMQKLYWERDDLTYRRPASHPVVAAYVVPKIELLGRYVSITKDTRLLDIGCGNGFFTFYFDRVCNTYGVDYSSKMLEMNPVKKKFRMDATHLEFKDNSFEIVFCHDLLHHLKDVDAAIQEMKRVSSKYVIILESNRNNPLIFLFACLIKEERRCLRFSLSYLIEAAKRNGLHILDSFSYGMVFPNKLPVFLLTLARIFNFKQPFAETNFIIAYK